MEILKPTINRRSIKCGIICNLYIYKKIKEIKGFEGIVKICFVFWFFLTSSAYYNKYIICFKTTNNNKLYFKISFQTTSSIYFVLKKIDLRRAMLQEQLNSLILLFIDRVIIPPGFSGATQILETCSLTRIVYL